VAFEVGKGKGFNIVFVLPVGYPKGVIGIGGGCTGGVSGTVPCPKEDVRSCIYFI